MAPDDNERFDTEERAATVMGALRCLEDLVSFQLPDVGIPSGNLAYLLRLINGEAEKVLPLERCSPHGRANNDE